MFEMKEDSYSDVVPEIEKMFQNRVIKIDSSITTNSINKKKSLKNNQKKPVASNKNLSNSNTKNNNVKTKKGVIKEDTKSKHTTSNSSR